MSPLQKAALAKQKDVDWDTLIRQWQESQRKTMAKRERKN